jgi:flagellar protein FlbD
VNLTAFLQHRYHRRVTFSQYWKFKVIEVTRLDKKKALLNIDAVKLIEKTPDTVITFMNGDNMVVLESLDEIRELVTKFHKAVLQDHV